MALLLGYQAAIWFMARLRLSMETAMDLVAEGAAVVIPVRSIPVTKK